MNVEGLSPLNSPQVHISSQTKAPSFFQCRLQSKPTLVCYVPRVYINSYSSRHFCHLIKEHWRRTRDPLGQPKSYQGRPDYCYLLQREHDFPPSISPGMNMQSSWPSGEMVAAMNSLLSIGNFTSHLIDMFVRDAHAL